MKSKWLIFFWIAAVSVITAGLLDLPLLYLIAKPLLMITLLLHFISASEGITDWRLYVAFALVFSWGGDVLLMPDGLFVAGLASFLVAHIFYIIAYQKTGAAQGRLRPFDVIVFGIYGIVLIGLLYPGLDNMLIPVVIYALVLLTMAVWAHKRRGATSNASFKQVSAGVILFVISDGMIALNRFLIEVPFERVLVMSTYILAQYMIVQGLLKHETPGV